MLRDLDDGSFPDLMVGAATGDDAAVWRIDDERALVATVDFITPVVDDARTWGMVAAANSLSDVYAMGGRPLFALNLVGWNSDALGAELLAQVLDGGRAIAHQAGCAVVGGHTIDDPEPKYGMSVIGEVDPARMLTNTGLTAGQHLVLTKPLGIGVVTTAIKADEAPVEVIDAAVASMTRLNDAASRVALDAGARGCTDVTGFGLLGHLGRMAVESGVDAVITVEAVPLLPGARELADAGLIPGGTRRNLAWASERLDAGTYPELWQLVLADAQTSGGLVFGVDPDHSAATVDALAGEGHDAAVIGHTAAGAGRITLR